MENVLSIQGLSKNYGRIKAVDNLSLDVERGQVYGILGPNGSGKTTTLGIVLSVISPNNGSFSWFGKTPTKEDRKSIGAILEVPIFYPYLSGERNLQIIADIRGCKYDGIPEVLEIVDLMDRKKSKFRTYSLGMKQRLALAAALLGDPKVLILDEPTNGLDPQGIAEIRELILKIAKKGITIILASHLLDEVQKICSHVAILDKGKKIFTGKVSEIINSSTLVEISAENMQELEKLLREHESIISVETEGSIFLVKLKDDFDIKELNQHLISNEIMITHLSSRKQSLENYFLELMAEK